MSFPTIDEIVAKVRELAAESPNFIYVRPPQRCLYLHGDQPGCLFGRALLELGVSASVLSAADQAPVAVPVSKIIRQNTPGDPEPGEMLKRKWCMVVQTGQDSGRSWGAAVADADQSDPYL